MGRKKSPPGDLPLFSSAAPPPPASDYVARNSTRIRALAARGILLGTSSWKYPGWKGQVYNADYRTTREFEHGCLAEYATLFPTVCADFALYDFPRADRLKVIDEQTPDGFSVSFKVTDRITIRRYPSLARYGQHAGTENPDFLNADLFGDAFLAPLAPLRRKLGAVIFEFSTFHPSSGVDAGTFTRLLDGFLSRLPQGYSYGVEVRNADFLTSDYLAMLSSHEAAHVLNNWTRMPPVAEQIGVRGILTAPFVVVRSLLRPGRSYQQAVDLFDPYDAVKEENAEARLGVAEVVRRCLEEGRVLYAYINNRVEGNAPKTIEGILDTLDTYPAAKL